MRTINFNEMALLNGGQAVSVAAATTNLTLDGGLKINWCAVGKGVAGLGTGLLICGVALSGGIATAAFATIVVATGIYC